MSDPTTPEGRAALRHMLNEATPRPWSVGSVNPHTNGYWFGNTHPDVEGPSGDAWEPDAELLVAAVNALPVLLDALDNAEATLDRVRELADELEASPKVGATGEEQWELDTRRVVGRELRYALDGEQ